MLVGSETHAGVEITLTLRPHDAPEPDTHDTHDTLDNLDIHDILDVHARVDAHGDLALERLLAALRHATSAAHLAAHAIAGPFRLEDILLLRALVPAEDHALAARWLRRRLAPDTVIQVEPAAPGQPSQLHASFARRGATPTSQRQQYTRLDGRIRVEAFELHVVEHCNLRCTACCNMSPYLPERTRSVADITAMCRAMAEHLDVDVFKIMGGEPLLHPQITEVILAIRATGISPIVRLFTNGLLLHTMRDDFWAALDELTISSYSSAPLKPAQLDAAKARARAHDVVLNIKPVTEFSAVMRADLTHDPAELQRTYDQCWLRHRCLVVRNERFYMCTRAAYADEFHRTILHGAHPHDHAEALAGDGLPLSTPDLGPALLAYLNRSQPLASCRFCHGGAGPLAPHTQLTKADVRAGRLRPLRVLGA